MLNAAKTPAVSAIAASIVTLTACTGNGHPLAGSSAPSSTGGRPAASGPVSASVSAPAFTAERAGDLARELASGDQRQLRSAVLIPAGQPLDPKAAHELTALGTITFDRGTFHPLSSTSATVAGTVQDPPPRQRSRWTFALVLRSGQWKLADARPTP